jgi:hypothetical protein
LEKEEWRMTFGRVKGYSPRDAVVVASPSYAAYVAIGAGRRVVRAPGLVEAEPRGHADATPPLQQRHGLVDGESLRSPEDLYRAYGPNIREKLEAALKHDRVKTQVAVPALYLNALEGRGAHLLTHNDYLARRDRDWMGPIYELLGLTVGAIQHDLSPEDRKAAYECDITYATNSEVGFDYLRDNMKFAAADARCSLILRPSVYPPVMPEMMRGQQDSYETIELKGKIVLLDFWDTRCGPCIKLMPHIGGALEK